MVQSARRPYQCLQHPDPCPTKSKSVSGPEPLRQSTVPARTPRARPAHHREPPHRHHLSLAPHLPGALDHLPPLRRCRMLPFLAQHLAPLGRQPLELAVALANRLLLLRRQRSELLPPLAQCLALLRSELVPLLEPLTRHRTLLRVHVEPPLAAARKRCLARGRERCPAVRHRPE